MITLEVNVFKHHSLFDFENFAERVNPFGADVQKIRETARKADLIARLDVEKSFRESMAHIEEAMKKWKAMNQGQKALRL